MINKAGLALIRKFEGCRLHAYPDPATRGEPWTIGYGHTGKDVAPNSTITVEEANQLLIQDISRVAAAVDLECRVPLSENQFAAVCCLVYNIGIGAFQKSTLLRLLNESRIREAADQFPRWNQAGGKPMLGLTRRRAAEKALFLSPSLIRQKD